MAGPKYSKAQRELFFDLLDRGGSVRAAAIAAGVHPGAAYTWLRNSGLVMRRGTPRVYTEQEKAEFFRLLAERGNVSAVARELGFTRVTCYKWAHQAGIFTSEARRVLPRREEFLRLRAEGLTRRRRRGGSGRTSVRRRTGTRASPSSIEAGSTLTAMRSSVASTSSNSIGPWPPRYDKLAVRYQATIHIAVINQWLRHS